MKKAIRVEITPKTIILTIILLLVTWLFFRMLSVVFLVFLAFSISALLSPVIDFLQSKKVPKNLSISIIYILFFVLLLLLVLLIYKPLFYQLQNFFLALPSLVGKVINAIVETFPWLKERVNWDEIISTIQGSFWQSSGVTDFISDLPKYVFSILGSFFTGLISFFSIIVLSIFFIQLKEPSKQKFVKLIQKRHRKKAINLINAIETQLAAWLRGQIILMLFIGVLSWLGPEIIGVEFSVPLGVVGGLFEVVPNIGPMITFVLAIIVAIGSEATLLQVILIAVWFILIQQFENYVVVPKLMQKVVGTNPIITTIAVLAGAKLLNVWGALLAVPAAAILQIMARHYIEYKEKKR